MTEITMPRLSDSMEEGTILTWLKADGERVARGEALLEIETDKATTTFESPEDGVLVIVAEAGATVRVGEVIARLGERAAAIDEAAVTEAPPAGDAQVPEAVRANGNLADRAVQATPVARRIASQHGVDIAALDGSGPRGRVTKADVHAKIGVMLPAEVLPGGSSPADAVPERAADAGAPASTAKGEVGAQELSRLQHVIARRMAEAKATIPDFQVQTEVAMNAALLLRSQLKAVAADAVPSLNDIVVKACALALREHPRANSSYRDGRFELHSRVNVGIAVAADDALVVPTINDADSRSLGSIAAEARRLAARVRSGEITPAELSGATFTISNLGMYGMTAIVAVVNPPQAAILGVGAIRRVPSLEDGQLCERPVMTLTLSCDHRILYGADAARFLSRIRELLETPLAVTL